MALWRAVNAEYRIDDAGGVEMLSACQALDRAEGLRARIDEDGAIIRTTTGLRDHLGLKHEVASRAFVVRTLTALAWTSRR